MSYTQIDRDEPLEGEVELWAVGTAGFPQFNHEWQEKVWLRLHPQTAKAIEYIRELEGLQGVSPVDGGLLWLFTTENEAIRAKNLMDAVGIKTGKQVGRVFADAKQL